MNDEAQHIGQMMNMQGWKIIEAEAKERLDSVMKRLLIAELTDIPALQAEARAMSLVLQFPRQLLESVRLANEAAPRKDEQSQN